jgi:hypothetical protein
MVNNQDSIYIKKVMLKNYPKDIQVVLSKNEEIIFKECLSQCKNYLEFGSGGSTFLALDFENCEKIVSVESDLNWLNHLKTFDIINFITIY